MASPLFVRVPWLPAVRHIYIQCSAVQWSAVQCSALLVSLLHNRNYINCKRTQPPLHGSCVLLSTTPLSRGTKTAFILKSVEARRKKTFGDAAAGGLMIERAEELP